MFAVEKWRCPERVVETTFIRFAVVFADTFRLDMLRWVKKLDVQFSGGKMKEVGLTFAIRNLLF